MASWPGQLRRVTLFSGADAFHDGSNLLDGDGDFNDNEVGDNYTANFIVATRPPDTRVVSLPDFSRGPGQAVGVPGTGSILPIKIDTRRGVQGGRRRRALQPDVVDHHRRQRWAADRSQPVAGAITSNSINIDATHRMLKMTVSASVSLSGSERRTDPTHLERAWHGDSTSRAR